MRKLVVLNEGEDPVPHVLYDLSIADITERRANRKFFPSGWAAANFLGVLPKTLYERKQNGHRITSKRDGKLYAIRVASKKDIEELKP